MTNHMTHDGFAERLMAFLEGDTDDATHAAMERHAQECAACGALLADLRGMRVEASKLPELTPSRDLWAGIAARIEAPVVPIGVANGATADATAAAPSRPGLRHWMRNGLAAAALTAAVGLGYLTGQSRTVTVATADSADTVIPLLPADGELAILMDSVPLDSSGVPVFGAPGFAPASARLAVATLTADYDREISRLRLLVDERRNQLDPVTVAVIEKNLRVIDVAITESKKAIARDPASRFLIESLNQSLESKVELLRIAAALPNRT